MHDEAWWDGEDDERIVALQQVLLPLREPPRPWGDVHAQLRFGASPRRRATAGLPMLAATVAVAAALALGWWWGRGDAQPPAIDRVIAPVPVAEPPASEPEPPTTVVVPMPIAVPVASDEAVARGARREMLTRQFQTLDERKKKRAAARTTAEDDEVIDDVEASVRASSPEDVARFDALPHALNTADIKAGIAPVKAAARACGAKHGAAKDEQVIVKLSIAGATGLVTSAVAQSPHGGTALGRCVAEALAKARFPRFQRVSMGVVYPVRM